MIIHNMKPKNCTCGFPDSGVKSISGHEQECHCNAEWWETQRKLMNNRFERERKQSNKFKYAHSDNVE